MLALIVATALAAAPPKNAAHDPVLAALSARDGFPGCATLGPLGSPDDVTDALIDIARHVTEPPWAPMRAAVCTTRLAAGDPLAWAAIQGWLGDPGVPGLALAVVQNLDMLPEDKALAAARIAQKRLPSPDGFGTYAPDALKKCSYASVREIGNAIPSADPSDPGTVKSFTPLPPSQPK